MATGTAAFTDADVAYLRSTFATLDDICAGRPETPAEVRVLIVERRLPRPSYVLEDGTEFVPLDYFALADAAGGVDGLRDEYERRYRATLRRHGLSFDADLFERRWEQYLDGISGMCMREVTPETIIRKRMLIDAIEGLPGGSPHGGRSLGSRPPEQRRRARLDREGVRARLRPRAVRADARHVHPRRPRSVSRALGLAHAASRSCSHNAFLTANTSQSLLKYA
jgi:hypothetical protein